MRIYSKFEAVVGKEIAGVVVKEAPDDSEPPHQVFFEFSDGTYLELYSDSRMRPTQLWEGGRAEIRSYMASGREVVFETAGEDRLVPDRPAPTEEPGKP